MKNSTIQPFGKYTKTQVVLDFAQYGKYMQEKLLSRQESNLLITIGKSSFFITRVSFICVTNTLLTFVLSKGMCPGCRLQYQKKKKKDEFS